MPLKLKPTETESKNSHSSDIYESCASSSIYHSYHSCFNKDDCGEARSLFSFDHINKGVCQSWEYN